MRILVVHNSYQRAGGEDAVVAAEIALMRSHGHSVDTLMRSNSEIGQISNLSLAAETLWSTKTKYALIDHITKFGPDIIHVHNTFPLISPSIYVAATSMKIPLVQTLHNFRLLCLNGLFLRDGSPCEDCLGRSTWRGVIRKCYRDSLPASAVTSSMITVHRRLNTYSKSVSRYIVPSEFSREKFIAGGLPADRIIVKGHFVEPSPPSDSTRDAIVFVGRLAPEKGISVLAAAARAVPKARIQVIGDGESSAFLESLANVEQLGVLDAAQVRSKMGAALALVVPSVSYETFGLVIAEAFASGTPVIASNIGALSSLVEDRMTGLLVRPSDPGALAAAMSWALNNQEEMLEMGRRARVRYEQLYSPSGNYKKLVTIYQQVISEAAS